MGLLLLALLAASFLFSSSSLESEAGNLKAEDESIRGGSVRDLGRRGMIVSEEYEVDVKDLGIHLDSGLGVFDAFFASLSMIIVSEIGDETFIIAALMAMRHPKSTVLSGALSALVVMTNSDKVMVEDKFSLKLLRMVIVAFNWTR